MASNTIGQLLVEIGLDSSKFNPELKKITNNIKGLEKDLRNMSKEFGDVGKSITGLEKKQELLNKVLSENNKAMNEHVKTRDNYADMIRKEKAELDELYSAQERDEKAIIKKEKSIQSLINKYNKEENAINKIANTNANYQKQLNEVNEQYSKLVNNIESYDERLESISQQTSLTNSELKAQQTILEANGKNWKAYNTQAQIVENSLASAVETWKTHREELSKSETELSKLTDVTEAHRKSLVKEQSTLQDILKIHGETSEEYQTQASYVERLTRQQIEYEQALVSTQEHVSKVKQSLASSKEEVAEYYQNLKQIGTTEVVRNLKQTSNVLGTVSEATQGASATAGIVGAGATTMFMAYETGLAKVSTLVDTSVVDMEKVGQDIIRISNETGTSIQDMMEGAYQALSAGVDIGNLNDFLSTSSKLATSGFTDMSSATKVLSQIMNNYGTSAGNAEQIASKLMKTQNLGVTTVAELSSEMSESLSLASTYGMNFDNVATAFAKMTKAGTSTNEAGTAIARMMEELGSSSSKVSEILQQKTGKSFTELAKGGESLYDILGYIQEYADETGVSMGDLWSSSNAGVGALQLLNAEGGSFNDMLKEISNSSGLLDESFGKMSDTAEFKLSSAINSLKNAFIDIGGALSPVIEGVSSAISGIAGFINNLGDGTKTAIGYITGFVAVLSSLAGIGSKVVGGLSGIWQGIMGVNTVAGFFGRDSESKFVKALQSIGEKGSEAFTKSFSNNNAKKAFEEFKEEVLKSDERFQKVELPIDFELNGKQLVEQSDEIKDKVIKNMYDGMDDLGSSASKSTGIFKTLWGVMSAHPYATVAVGIGLVTTALVAYKSIAEKIKQKKIDDLQIGIKTQKEEIQNEKTKLERLKEIAEEYDTLYGKVNKTKEEEERLKELTAEIAELYPELVESYDENGDPILKLNGNAETYIATLERAIEKQEELLKKDENELADRQKEQLGGIKERQQDYENKKDEYENLDTPNYAYQDRLKDEQAEYDKALQAYKDYNEAKLDINEGYLNELQTTNDYINSTAKEKENLDSLYRDTFDFANLYSTQGEAGVDKFISQTDKLKKVMIDSSEVSKENAKNIEKMQDSFGKTNNLGKYTDDLTKLYETSGKFDKNSLETWFNSVEEYASSTGDLEGANKQVQEMAQTLEKLTGIDASIWEDLFHINAEPLTVAEERMHSFLEAYGTGAGNLGKGGLADNLEQEFNQLETLTDKLTNEYKDGIDIETAVRLTNNAPTPIKNLVDEMIKENGVIDTELLTQASIEIRNQGEISEDTKAKLKEIFPDKTDEEIEALFTVEADVKNQQEIENLLGQWDELDLDVKAQIRAEVDNAEEATRLHELIKDLPKEKQIQVINDFSNAKEEARLLGVEVDQLPLSKKLQYDTVFKGDEQVENLKKTLKEIPDEVETSITTEMEQAGKLDEFYRALAEVDGKKVTAFLQQEGAVEALLKCESVEEMLQLINDKDTAVNIDVDDKGAKDGIEATKTGLNEVDGTTATGVITVESEDEALQQTQGTLVELDGQQYLVVVNVDTGEKELVPFKQELNTLPTEKNISVNATDNASGTLGIVASITIGDKTFSVNCSDLATQVIVGVINQIIPGKMFDITCTDNASSKVGTVEGLKIGDKSFTISALDKASSVISKIKGALDAVKSKTVSVWTKYFSTGKQSAVKEPQIVEMQSVGRPIVIDDFNQVVSKAQASIQASATTFANAENDAIATIQASGYTDTILASEYWANQSKHKCSLV